MDDIPTLAQMYATVNSKTAYTRPDEIYGALSEAGFLVYTATLKEFSGVFLKFDTTTIVLTPGQQQYAMPLDLGNLVHFAERQTGSQRWRTIEPETISEAMNDAQSDSIWEFDGYDCSDLRFYGPFLPAAVVGVPLVQQVLISPLITQTLMTEMAYTAKYLPVVSAQSFLTLPEEGTYAQQNFALAEIHRGNDNTLAAEYERKANVHLTAYLTWVRNRQTVRWPTITPYLGG